MTDIERRLRDLGERLREEQNPSAMPPRTIRAAKRRRLGTALTGMVTVAALVLGASFAAGAFSPDRPQIGPAQERSDVLIEYRRSGGFEGSEARLTVYRKGDSVLHHTQGTTGLTAEGTLSEVELADLERAIAALDWPAIDGSHDLAPGVGVADGYEYEIRHKGYVVTTVSGAEPRELEPLIELLDAVIAIQRALHGQPEPADCGPPVDFEPTYLPEGWSRDLQRGTGGGGRAYPGLLGHYGEVEIGYYDLVIGAPFAQSNKSDIPVLGRRATSGDIHEGFSVEFNYDGCNYSLIAHVFDRSDLERFAEGLRFKERGEDPPSRQGFAAIWPEDIEERAGEECTSVQHVDGHWRSDPVRTAERFASDVLGWQEAQATQNKREGGFSVYVGNGPISSDQPTVVVHVDELFGGCWSVISVSRLPEEQPKEDGSMSVRGRDVSMGFDLGGASSATFEVGYSGQKTTHTWEGGKTGVEFRLDFEPRGTGHFLVLLRDENGEVFSAFGSPLPEGDFAAG